MATANVVAKLIDAKVIRDLHNNLIAERMCTQKGVKDGDTLTFLGLSPVTIGTYTGADITAEEIQDASVKLIIDQQNYFAFKVGDIQKYQSVVDLQGSQAEEAAYGIKNVMDKYFLSLYAGAANTVTATVTSANVLSTLAQVRRLLSEQNVGRASIIVPPWFMTRLRLAAIKLSVNEGMKGAGYAGFLDDLNMDIYESNNVTNTGTLASPVSEIMAMAPNSIVFGKQIGETETDREVLNFKTVVKGLYTYGAKMIKPKQVVRLTATEGAAETAI